MSAWARTGLARGVWYDRKKKRTSGREDAREGVGLEMTFLV